jgi:hypothetical protein
MNVSTARGQARGIADQVERIIAEETVGALICGFALRVLRDQQMYLNLGYKNLNQLLAVKIPALDRASTKRLLVLGDTYKDEDLAKIIPLSINKLWAIARVTPDTRDEYLAAGLYLPSDELARQIRDLTARSAAIKLRISLAAEDLPVMPPGDETGEKRNEPKTAENLLTDQRATLINSLLSDVESGWSEMTRTAFEIGRLLTRLRDEKLAYLLYNDGGDARIDFSLACAEAFGFSTQEVERYCLLFTRLKLVPLAERRRLGLTALYELAKITDPASREALLTQIRQDNSAGDTVIPLAQEASAPILRGPKELGLETPLATSVTAAKTEWTDDPARLVPYNLLFLFDRPGGSKVAPATAGFADATPGELIEQILLRYTIPGDELLDLTAGSGSVARIAQIMGRRIVSIDILTPPMIAGVRVGDARNWTADDLRKFKLIIFHPPVPGEVRYSERYSGRPLRGDLSELPADEFKAACLETFKHIHRQLLADGGLLIIITHESHAFGHFVDWPAKLALAAEKVGLIPRDRLYAVQSPEQRKAKERTVSFRARHENKTIGVVTSAVVMVKEQNRP